MALKYLMKCSASLANREMQIIASLRFVFFSQSDWLSSITQPTRNAVRFLEKGNTHSLLVALQTGAATVENSVGISQKCKS